MSKTLNDCLKRALSKAKPVLDKLELPIHPAHLIELANSLVLTECDDNDAWQIVRILYNEASTLDTYPHRRKVLEPIYRASQP